MTTDPGDTLRRVEKAMLATDRVWIERQLRTWRIAQGVSGAAERRRFVELCRWRRELAATVEALSEPPEPETVHE